MADDEGPTTLEDPPMPHLQLRWQVSLELAAAFLLVGLLVRVLVRDGRWRQLAPAAVQAGLLVGLYGLWGLVGEHAAGTVDGAQQRGLALWQLERRLHVLGEGTMQDLVLPHPLLTQAANTYYVYGHVNVLIALLAWVWWRHRSAYLRLCAVIVVFTAAASALQLVSVAPPRLLPGHLVVDTATRYGQSVYGAADPGAISQLAAMPSIHVGWALLAGVTVALLGRTGWRAVGMVHAVVMSLVVVVTGNHYWVDGVVAGLLLGLTAVVVVAAARALTGRRPRLTAQPSDGPRVSTSRTGAAR